MITSLVQHSAAIDTLVYDEKTSILYVLFLTGRFYKYEDVPLQTAVDFFAADSKGKFFQANIKGKFTQVDNG